MGLKECNTCVTCRTSRAEVLLNVLMDFTTMIHYFSAASSLSSCSKYDDFS